MWAWPEHTNLPCEGWAEAAQPLGISKSLSANAHQIAKCSINAVLIGYTHLISRKPISQKTQHKWSTNAKSTTGSQSRGARKSGFNFRDNEQQTSCVYVLSCSLINTGWMTWKTRTHDCLPPAPHSHKAHDMNSTVFWGFVSFITKIDNEGVKKENALSEAHKIILNYASKHKST